MELEDPFVDEQPAPREPTRESLQSFWGLTACLAILAYLGSFLGPAVSYGAFELISSKFIQNPWQWRFGIAETFILQFCVVPSAIIIAITPILNWRGGLAPRFAITVAIGITAMNFAANRPFQTKQILSDSVELTSLCGLWIALPLLFLYTPIKTRQLRIVVAAGVFVLAFCVSMIFRNFVPRNIDILCWEVIYGSAMAFALLRRNWGRTALLEANTSVDQIQKTSTATLLELMAVCSLACVASMYWAERNETRTFALLGFLAVVGPMIAWVTMSCLKRQSGIYSIVFQAGALFFLLSLFFSGGAIADMQMSGQLKWIKPTTRDIVIASLSLCLSSCAGLTAQFLAARALLKLWGWRLA